MPRLILFPQTDEIVTAVAPLTVDEDGDGWWSGVQQHFVAVPFAATLAAVALSASLAFGYQQQTEDIVPQPAPTFAADDEGWVCPQAVQRLRWVPKIWIAQGDEASLAVVSSEDDWQPHLFLRVSSPPSVHLLYLPDPEEVPGTLVVPILELEEEYWWTAFSLPGALYAPVLAADDEIVPLPPPTEYALDSGTWMAQRVASSKRVVTVY